MRTAWLWVMCVTGLGAGLLPVEARAEEPVTVAGLANVRATENPGFGELKWGSDVRALYAQLPALKKLYPEAKVAAAVKARRTVVLDTKLVFKGQTFDARLALDDTGLFRVVLEVNVEEEVPVAGALDKLLDPLLGDLSAADDETPEARVWKGAATVVSVTRTQGVGRWRADIAFWAPAKFKTESSPGALGAP